MGNPDQKPIPIGFIIHLLREIERSDLDHRSRIIKADGVLCGVLKYGGFGDVVDAYYAATKEIPTKG